MNRILFLIAFIFLSNHAISQIYYIDIPDTIVFMPSSQTWDSANFYYFDLNGDDMSDYYFKLHHYLWNDGVYGDYLHAFLIEFYGIGNNIAVESANSCIYKFNFGDTINENTSNWYDYSYIHVDLQLDIYDCGVDDNYFGLKLIQNNQAYFGWVKIFTNNQFVRVEEFAYNTIPGATILAGQTEDFSSIEVIPLEDFKIYAAHGNMHISNPNQQNRIQSVNIYNQMGQEVIYHQEKGYQINIDINQFNSGLYIIKILTEDGIVVRKHFFQ